MGNLKDIKSYKEVQEETSDTNGLMYVSVMFYKKKLETLRVVRP